MVKDGADAGYRGYRTVFPDRFELVLWSFLPIMLGGIFLGIKAAVHHDKFVDQAARIFSIIGYAFPTFVFWPVDVVVVLCGTGVVLAGAVVGLGECGGVLGQLQ